MCTRDKASGGPNGIVEDVVVIKAATTRANNPQDNELTCLLWSLFGYCIFVTFVSMAAIPYGAYAACRAMKKDIDTDLKVSRSIPSYEPKIPNRKVLEYTPVKYNGKMMNSIWGLYNRYSPHNIKKSCDADLHFKYGKDQQQSA